MSVLLPQISGIIRYWATLVKSMDQSNSRLLISFRDLIVGFLGGAACMAVAFGVGFVVNLLFPSEGPAYVGIGLGARNLPGTILGVLAWIGIVAIFANPFRKN
jgi:hypothetical protein